MRGAPKHTTFDCWPHVTHAAGHATCSLTGGRRALLVTKQVLRPCVVAQSSAPLMRASLMPQLCDHSGTRQWQEHALRSRHGAAVNVTLLVSCLCIASSSVRHRVLPATLRAAPGWVPSRCQIGHVEHCSCTLGAHLRRDLNGLRP